MSRYVVGIDLGTTNSALAYAAAEGEAADAGTSPIEHLPIPQVVGVSDVAERPLLPSFLYLPASKEFPPGALDLPWKSPPDRVVGTFAREHGAKVPGRLVSSAKSWLSHAGVDRRSPILPWTALEDVPKVSPVTASAAYLEHLRDAWNTRVAGKKADDRLENQDVLLTVPASFDAVARELTMEAAGKAGLKHVTLLEEPQAAFYAWLAVQGDAWRQHVKVGDIILVCDVGGGTTDFTLISVTDEGGDLVLSRLAVGEHILLGGDNMDLALAYAVAGNPSPGHGRPRRRSARGPRPRLPVGQGDPLRRAQEELCAGDRAGPRVEGDRRIDQDRAHPRPAERLAARGLPAALRPDRRPLARPADRTDRDRPSLRRRPRDHPPPRPLPRPAGRIAAHGRAR